MLKWIKVNRSVTFVVCGLQSEPFNGQGSLPSGAAGGYNAFTQAAVNGVSPVNTHFFLSLNQRAQIDSAECMKKTFSSETFVEKFVVLKTCSGSRYSARSRWSDARIPQLPNGRESYPAHDSW